LDELALARLAGHQRRAAVAACEQAGPAVQAQPAAQLLRPGGVAGVAVLDQDGADLLLEELAALRGGRPDRTGREAQEQPGGQSAAGVKVFAHVACRPSLSLAPAAGPPTSLPRRAPPCHGLFYGFFPRLFPRLAPGPAASPPGTPVAGITSLGIAT